MNKPQTDTINGFPCTWLQDVGYHPATPAGELKAGMTMVWNTGATSRVVEVTQGKNHFAITAPVTEGFVTIHEAITSGGVTKYYKRRKSAKTLVATKEALEAYRTAKETHENT